MALDLRKTPDLHHFDLETDKLGRIRCEFITGDLQYLKGFFIRRP